MPFNKYPEFIKQELDKFYLVKKYNADPERFLGQENELKYYNGAQIYATAQELMTKNISLKILITERQ